MYVSALEKVFETITTLHTFAQIFGKLVGKASAGKIYTCISIFLTNIFQHDYDDDYEADSKS